MLLASSGSERQRQAAQPRDSSRAYRPALGRVVALICRASQFFAAEHHFCSPQTPPLQLPGTPALLWS